MSTPDKPQQPAHPPGWDKMAVPEGTSAIMTPAMARAVAATPRRYDDEPLVAAPVLSELGESATQALRNLGELRSQIEGLRGSQGHAAAVASLGALGRSLEAIEFPAAKSGGWWPLGRGKEREAEALARQQCDAALAALQQVQAAVKALGEQVRDRANRAARVRTLVEVEAHALEQVVDQGRRKAGGVVEALKRQAALVVDDADKLRRVEEVRVLTDQFTTRIQPMAKVSAAAVQLAAQLKQATVVADFERREGKFGVAASEWREAISQFDSEARLETAREATVTLQTEVDKALRLVQAMATAQQALDAASDALASELAGAA